MDNILFIIIFILVPFLLFYIAKISNVDLLKPSLISIGFILYIVFSYIGILPLYFGLDDYRVRLGINDKSIIFNMWLMSSISITIIIMTYILLAKYLKLNSKDKLYIPEKKSNGLLVSDVAFFTLYIISTLVFLYYLTKLPKIPIFAAIQGETSMTVKAYRSMATNSFAGKSHYYNMFIDNGLTLTTFYFFVRYLTKKTKESLIIFIIVLGTCICSVVYTTQKAPLVWLILGLYSIYLIMKNKKYNIKFLLIFSTISVPFLYYFYSNFMNMKGRGIIEIVSAIFSRTFSGQLTPSYYYLQIYPQVYGFLYGKSFPNPGGIFGFERVNLPVEVFQLKLSAFVSGDIVGSAPAPFWAESYSNFGWLGVIASSIYIGILFIVLETFFKKMQLDFITLPFYIMFALELKNIALGGISNFIFNINFLFLISLLLIFTLKRKEDVKKNDNMSHYYSTQIK